MSAGGRCEKIFLRAVGAARAGGVDCVIDGSGSTLLHHAIVGKHAAIAEAVAAKSSKKTLDAPDVEGDTPLILAVKSSQIAVVRMLLKLKANQFAKDKDGRTALEYAKAVVLRGDRSTPGGALRASAALEMAALMDTAARGQEF